MADDADDADKTEAPTPKKLRDAREKGNVARSADLTAAAVLLAGAELLGYGGGHLALSLRAVMEQAVDADRMLAPAADVPAEFARVALAVAWGVAPLMLGLMAVAVAANVLQVGFALHPEKLAPDVNHLNPAKGIKRLFGGGRGPVGLLMNFAKLGVVGGVAYTAIHGRMAEIVALQQLPALGVFGFGAQVLWTLATRTAWALLILALLDYAFQRYTTTKQLRMTKEEVKREMKEMDGDPLLKQRRRQIALQRAREAIRRSVPTADVVVINPTHFAVALKYDEAKMRAPTVVAKGADLLAQRIREAAAEHGVPVVERKPLARALYDTVPIGGEIPEDLYAAVADILAYVYGLNADARAVAPAAAG